MLHPSSDRSAVGLHAINAYAQRWSGVACHLGASHAALVVPVHEGTDGQPQPLLLVPLHPPHPCLPKSSTAQHSTAQHSTAQHSTAQHSTAQHSTAQHSTAQAFPLHLPVPLTIADHACSRCEVPFAETCSTLSQHMHSSRCFMPGTHALKILEGCMTASYTLQWLIACGTLLHTCLKNSSSSWYAHLLWVLGAAAKCPMSAHFSTICSTINTCCQHDIACRCAA